MPQFSVVGIASEFVRSKTGCLSIILFIPEMLGYKLYLFNLNLSWNILCIKI